jgi:CheY-like chemotaxis protein
VARILIVDDNESDRTILSAVLERAGHETFVAEDGEAAVSLCREKSFQVVITDLQMHEIHGLELITLLRDLSPRPTIIAISGTGSVQLHMAQALGATVTLRKPVDPEELLRAITEAVDG